MAERSTKLQRAKMQNQAEREISKHTDDNAKWVYNVLGIRLDPLQILRMKLLDEHRQTIAWDARRMRKSTTHFIHALKRLATRDHEECCAITPRRDQANKAMDEYMLTQIRNERAPLYHFLDYRNGRKRLNDTSFTFHNKSNAWTAGIMGEVDGSGITIALMDEIEDMDYDRLTSKFLPMLGQAEKLGATRKAEPQVRALGVIKGSGIRKAFLDQGFFPMTQPGYPNGPIIGDAYMGLELGILDKDWIMKQQGLMSPGDWMRQQLCRDVHTDSVILLKWAKKAQQLALRLGDAANIVEPLPGKQYKKRGLISFGYDHLGHGEKAENSRSALVVSEMFGEHIFFLFVQSWDPWEDETKIMEDLIFFWRYFMPDIANGDALGIGMITEMNDRLYQLHLTQTDRLSIGDGKSSGSTWPEWAFSPLRFHGEQKYKMAQTVRTVFQRGRAVIPWFDDHDLPEDGIIFEFNRFIAQLCNIVEEQNNSSYPTFKSDDLKVGDDYFDAAMAGVWGLMTRYVAPPAVIATRGRTRDELLLPHKAA